MDHLKQLHCSVRPHHNYLLITFIDMWFENADIDQICNLISAMPIAHPPPFPVRHAQCPPPDCWTSLVMAHTCDILLTENMLVSVWHVFGGVCVHKSKLKVCILVAEIDTS